MTLQEIRNFVRTHMDLDSTELPDSMLDVFIRDGSKRIERHRNRWPFYESSWTLPTVAGTASYATDAAPFVTAGNVMRDITEIRTPTLLLQWLGLDDAHRRFPLSNTGTGTPLYFTKYATSLTMHPTPGSALSYTVVGYREPADWMATGAGATPDMPADLHHTLALWALGRSYAQQEDTDLGQFYLEMHQDELERFARSLETMPPSQPLVLNGRVMSSWTDRLRYDWE